MLQQKYYVIIIPPVVKKYIILIISISNVYNKGRANLNSRENHKALLFWSKINALKLPASPIEKVSSENYFSFANCLLHEAHISRVEVNNSYKIYIDS